MKLTRLNKFLLFFVIFNIIIYTPNCNALLLATKLDNTNISIQKGETAILNPIDSELYTTWYLKTNSTKIPITSDIISQATPPRGNKQVSLPEITYNKDGSISFTLNSNQGLKFQINNSENLEEIVHFKYDTGNSCMGEFYNSGKWSPTLQANCLEGKGEALAYGSSSIYIYDTDTPIKIENLTLETFTLTDIGVNDQKELRISPTENADYYKNGNEFIFKYISCGYDALPAAEAGACGEVYTMPIKLIINEEKQQDPPKDAPEDSAKGEVVDIPNTLLHKPYSLIIVAIILLGIGSYIIYIQLQKKKNNINKS